MRERPANRETCRGGRDYRSRCESYIMFPLATAKRHAARFPRADVARRTIEIIVAVPVLRALDAATLQLKEREPTALFHGWTLSPCGPTLFPDTVQENRDKKTVATIGLTFSRVSRPHLRIIKRQACRSKSHSSAIVHSTR